MKDLSNFVTEKLVISKDISDQITHVTTKEELRNIIKERMKHEGHNCNLNDIDVSEVTDMSYLFAGTSFNGNISEWDVSNVVDMRHMFDKCREFNGDISKWDVSNVTNMTYMFYYCEAFNQDLSDWKVDAVEIMSHMFEECKSFNQDLSRWNVGNVFSFDWMFAYCDKFNGRAIESWDKDITKYATYNKMFEGCKSIPFWYAMDALK